MKKRFLLFYYFFLLSVPLHTFSMDAEKFAEQGLETCLKPNQGALVNLGCKGLALGCFLAAIDNFHLLKEADGCTIYCRFSASAPTILNHPGARPIQGLLPVEQTSFTCGNHYVPTTGYQWPGTTVNTYPTNTAFPYYVGRSLPFYICALVNESGEQRIVKIPSNTVPASGPVSVPLPSANDAQSISQTPEMSFPMMPLQEIERRKKRMKFQLFASLALFCLSFKV